MEYSKELAKEFNIKEEYAGNIITLLDEGNTIPFIARYRKEMHGTLDDQTIREISERLEYLRNLDKRRSEVAALIGELGLMTDEVMTALDNAVMLSEIEDIYRPFKPKRKTRASVAKEKGLQGLADMITEQSAGDPYAEAEKYVDAEKGVETAEDAVKGAMDIIAENVSDDPEIRKRLKNIIRLNAVLCSKAADAETESVYKPYYDYSEPVRSVPGHRLLAIDRGEREGFLKVSIDIEPQKCINIINRLRVSGDNACSQLVKEACEDAYTRLIFPSVEREIRSEMTDNADEQAFCAQSQTAAHAAACQGIYSNRTRPRLQNRLQACSRRCYRNGA